MKKILAYSLVFSLIFNTLAFASSSVIELDFRGSEAPDRLHVMPRLSYLEDVSHVAIDPDLKEVRVHKKNQKDGVQDAQIASPITLSLHNISNSLWDLEPEKLTAFLMQQTAWLKLLEGDDYKLEIKGGLLGGGNAGSTGGGNGGNNNSGGGANDRVTVRPYCPSNPNWSASGNVPCGRSTPTCPTYSNDFRRSTKSAGDRDRSSVPPGNAQAEAKKGVPSAAPARVEAQKKAPIVKAVARVDARKIAAAAKAAAEAQKRAAAGQQYEAYMARMRQPIVDKAVADAVAKGVSSIELQRRIDIAQAVLNAATANRTSYPVPSRGVGTPAWIKFAATTQAFFEATESYKAAVSTKTAVDKIYADKAAAAAKKAADAKKIADAAVPVKAAAVVPVKVAAVVPVKAAAVVPVKVAAAVPVKAAAAVPVKVAAAVPVKVAAAVPVKVAAVVPVKAAAVVPVKAAAAVPVKAAAVVPVKAAAVVPVKAAAAVPVKAAAVVPVKVAAAVPVKAAAAVPVKAAAVVPVKVAAVVPVKVAAAVPVKAAAAVPVKAAAVVPVKAAAVVPVKVAAAVPVKAAAAVPVKVAAVVPVKVAAAVPVKAAAAVPVKAAAAVPVKVAAVVPVKVAAVVPVKAAAVVPVKAAAAVPVKVADAAALQPASERGRQLEKDRATILKNRSPSRAFGMQDVGAEFARNLIKNPEETLKTTADIIAQTAYYPYGAARGIQEAAEGYKTGTYSAPLAVGMGALSVTPAVGAPIKAGVKQVVTAVRTAQKVTKTIKKPSAAQGQTQNLVGGVNKYKEQLFARKNAPKGNTTLKAAEQELKGKQLPIAQERGRTYDHVEKVKSAQKGLRDHIKNLNNRLSHPALSAAERKVLQDELAKTSKLLDHTEQFVPRKKI